MICYILVLFLQYFKISDDERHDLLARGLILGCESITFRLFNGVFAIVRNVPLEVTKNDVLDAITTFGWHIGGPAPTSQIYPQLSVLYHTSVKSGRWICMLDAFPDVPIAADGSKRFWGKAFGNRTISFDIKFKQPAKTLVPPPAAKKTLPPQTVWGSIKAQMMHRQPRKTQPQRIRRHPRSRHP